MISTDRIKNIIDGLTLQRNRDSTRKMYYSVWKVFSNFYLSLDVKPDTWADRVTLFVRYLVDQNRKAGTIKSYVSALKAILRDDKIEINEDKYLLSSLTKACVYHNDVAVVRFPIRKPMLDALLHSVDHLFLCESRNQPYLATLYKAMFATAYYGMFRVGEIAKGTHRILARDVHIGVNKQKILFMLRTSKTHWKNTVPQSVKITSTRINFSNDSNRVKLFCPYKLLMDYLHVRDKYKTDSEPFFIFHGGEPVSPGHINRILKGVLKDGGFGPSKYSMHGMRSGRAEDLLRLGLSVETIKKLGRWRSKTVFTYLKQF